MAIKFRITHPWSGFEGIFEAETSDEALDEALDALARSMGYRNYTRARLAGRLDAIEMNVERVDGEDDNRTSCADILAHLSKGDLEDLAAWRRFEDKDSVHLGGQGRTPQQIEEANRAWALLSLDAQLAFIEMRRAVVDDLIATMREVGIPDTDRYIDAVEALLGHDHPAFRIMPAYALAHAYLEALDHVEA